MELTKLNQNLPRATSKLQAMPKVTPEVMMIVYLDEIAGRLAELQESLAEITSEGHLDGKVYAVTAEPVAVYIFARGLTLYNDGTSSVYLLPQKGKPISNNDAEIKRDEKLDLDFGTKRRRSFYLVCASGGTATARVFTW